MLIAVVVLYQSKNPCYHCCSPFPFDAELNAMNEFGWVRGSNCKIVKIGMLALARGGQASQFFVVESPAKNGEIIWRYLGGESDADARQTWCWRESRLN